MMLLGIALVSVPFFAITAIGTRMIGFWATVMAYALTAGIVACVCGAD